MGLDWNIRINGEDPDHAQSWDDWPKSFKCNGMTIEYWLDGCTAGMVADLGFDPRYPLWPSEMKGFLQPSKNSLDAEDMLMLAKLIAQRAECSEHVRIAAWLWSWAEQDSPGEKITCYISY